MTPDLDAHHAGVRKEKIIVTNLNTSESVKRQVCEVCGCVVDPTGEFPHECDFDGILRGGSLGGSPYLETVELDGGGYKAKDVTKACGSSVIQFRGVITDYRYYKRLFCMKPFCPKCTAKKGRLHKKRIQAVYKRLPEKLKGVFLRQWVFTIPDSVRDQFKSRERLNQLTRAVSRILKKFYQGRGWVVYVHLVGDSGEFHPHVNVHIPEETGGVWKETPERLATIRARWEMSLTGILGHPVGDMGTVVHYSFRRFRWQMRHSIKYMARADFRYTDEMVDFMSEELKGFQYLRFGGTLRNEVYREEAVNKKELEDAAGERLVFEEIRPFREVDMMYMPWELEEVAPGLYRETEPAYRARTHKKGR